MTKVNRNGLITHMQCLSVSISYIQGLGLDFCKHQDELNLCEKYLNKEISESEFVSEFRKYIEEKKE